MLDVSPAQRHARIRTGPVYRLYPAHALARASCDLRHTRGAVPVEPAGVDRHRIRQQSLYVGAAGGRLRLGRRKADGNGSGALPAYAQTPEPGSAGPRTMGAAAARSAGAGIV